MKYFLFCVLCCATVFGVSAGTVIYKTEDGKKNIMSDVKILSIDGNLMILKIGKATRSMGRSSLLKYYDTDIKLSGLFEDGSAEYTVSVVNVNMPQTGMTKNREKKSVATAEFDYTIARTGEGSAGKNVRMPYFYLFVLTSGRMDYGSRAMYVYHFPDEAKVRDKGYNEAQMLEKVLSADRPTVYNRAGGVLGNSSHLASTRKASFKLTGIGSRRIFAYYLLVWGKTWIVAEKEEKNPESQIGNRWWLWHSSDRK